MKTAIVLSGGGAKGAYELGVWKALRKLGITYDIVVGTSIGALNAAMMVQNDYYKCLKLWYFMNYNYVSNMEIKGKYNTKTGKKEILSKYAKGALKGGLEMDGLEKVIDYAIDYNKFFKSKINYGLVTTYFPSFKGKYVTKDKLNDNNLKSYLMATASCFPAFKPYKINNNYYVDGGYTDNLPIKMALDMGADNIIAVDMGAVGINKKVNTDVPISYIRPNNKLGSLLVFEKDYTRSYLKLGFNDTMKIYKKLDGNKYTFKKNSIIRNYNRISYRLERNLDKNANMYDDKTKKFIKQSEKEYYIDIIETLMGIFNLSFYSVYRTSEINIILKKHLRECVNKKLSLKMFRQNKINLDLIYFMYDKVITNNKNLKRYINMFPKAYLCVIYLLSI